jgi:hypothetical protein
MSAITKDESHVPHDVGSALFDQFSALLSWSKAPSMGTVTREVKRSVRRFHATGSQDDVAAN